MKVKYRKIMFALLFPLLVVTVGCASKKNMEESVVYQGNKIIPKQILEEAKTALSFYPELKDVPINFQYKDDIKMSFMQAQPDFGDIFNGKNKRSYNIFMSSRFKIQEEEVEMEEVPSDVLIGWLGHELGHIMDYRDKSATGLMVFGLRYITSKNYLENAERAADVYAVNHGMADYILATKDFILNNASLSDEYKEKISRHYLSPEEIVVLVNELEEEEAEEEVESSS